MTSAYSPLPFFSAPLASVLEDIQFRLRRVETASVFVATAHLSELSQRDLPSHVQVTSRPLIGRRVPVRNARYFRRTRVVIAQYPDSQMDESAVPTLLYVINGLAKINVGDYILRCQPGDFILLPPQIPKGKFLSHARDDSPHTTCDILYLSPGRLLGDGLECWIAHSAGDKVTSNAGLGAALLQNGFLATLFNELHEKVQAAPQSEIALLLLRSLTIYLLQEIYEGRALIPDTKRFSQPMEYSHSPIKHALSYIDSHIHEHLTIDIMAREAALSARSFTQLFRQEVGSSFHHYLTARRLEHAEKLLVNTDLKVQEIARLVGLSPSRFNRLFHTHYTCSPGTYRQEK